MRRGRRTNSPAQLGQVCFIRAAQSAQNVHSYEQICASASPRSVAVHFSQTIFISNAMFCLEAINPELVKRDKYCAGIDESIISGNRAKGSWATSLARLCRYG